MRIAIMVRYKPIAQRTNVSPLLMQNQSAPEIAGDSLCPSAYRSGLLCQATHHIIARLLHVTTLTARQHLLDVVSGTFTVLIDSLPSSAPHARRRVMRAAPDLLFQLDIRIKVPRGTGRASAGATS